MKIPKSFKCAGFTITVELIDKLESGNYGEFCDATNTISLAKIVPVKDRGDITVTEQQLYNTFAHEVVHVWQFYYNNEYSEAEAQVFANFICEYFNTKENKLCD